MRMTQAQYIETLTRLERNSKRTPEPKVSGAVEMEMDLHAEIMKWCEEQWPRVKYIRARSDKASTIQNGAQDFTIFMPDEKVLCVECKSKNNKLSSDQMSWAKEMSMLGHTVHEVRSMEQFISIVENSRNRKQ